MTALAEQSTATPELFKVPPATKRNACWTHVILNNNNSINYDKNVLTKLISEISEDQKVRQSKKHEPIDDLIGCKQALSLSDCLNPLYLVIKLKVDTLELLLIIHHCTV